jgi:FeS assembly protein IscX
MAHTFGWLEVEEIAALLAERHPELDPLRVNFVELKKLVQSLPGFAEEPGHPCNEKILETVQAKWIEEKEDLAEEDE